jgi:hypothetical protein
MLIVDFSSTLSHRTPSDPILRDVAQSLWRRCDAIVKLLWPLRRNKF